MITDIHWINDPLIGLKRIGTMARPRGNDWLNDEIKWMKIKEVDCLVSLLEKSEEFELGLDEEADLCARWGIEFKSFPIKDVNTPKNEADFIKIAIELAHKIKENKRIVIHCRMGIGRASILAAAIMIRLGCPKESVFEVISSFRKLKVPDTQDQKEWILAIAEEIERT